MDQTTWKRVQELFEGALAHPVDQRESYLRNLCAGDETLLAEVQALLDADARAEALHERVDFNLNVNEELEPGSLVGAYRIVERIGAGGMGIVYRALDTRLERTVALKFLPAHLSTVGNAKQRFVQEARAASALDHPHICTVHDIGDTQDGELYIAMAYYDGDSLDALVRKGPLPLALALTIAMQLSDALSAAHESGIYHRDLKPANIIITERGAKIVDFGIAKMVGVDITATGVRMGTPAYMAPEQLLGVKVDQRADVWALGVVLYEMLTGERPFDVSSATKVMARITTTEPAASLLERRRKLPAAIRAIVERALAPELDDRYQTMQEMHASLACAREQN